MADDFILVTTTTDREDSAERLASLLVERNLAACVQIVRNVKSVYRWKGEIQREPEYLLIIKTRMSMVSAIERTLDTEHPYEVPELIAVPITVPGAGYRRWLDESLARG